MLLLAWLKVTAAPVALWKFFATSSSGVQGRNGELAGGVLYPPAANSDSVTSPLV